MELRWLDPDHLDDKDVAGAVAVVEAARRVDAPHQRQKTTASFVADVRHGWDGHPGQYAVAREAGPEGAGRVVAVMEVDLITYDNTHLSLLDIWVDPLERRRGHGSRLLDVALDLTRADGRRLVLAEAWDGSAGATFLERHGFDLASVGLERRQVLTDLDRTALDREYAAALPAAEAYELVRLRTPLPDDLLGDVATMTSAINDAPLDDLDVEDEVFSPERIRAFEVAQLAHGRRLYRLAARERGTGVLAGHTVVAVEAEQPWFGWQLDTSVLRAHRGHRLGLLLKTAMLHWLAEDEPQLRTLHTGNAETNAHMIEINERLGYQVLARGAEWQRKV